MKEAELKYNFNLNLLKAIMLISVCSFIGNIVLGFPASTLTKWGLSFLVSFLCYIYNKIKGFSKILTFFYFLILTVAVLPYGFISAGGSRSNMLVYLSLDIIMATCILEGNYRNVIVGINILVFIAMYTFEFYYPSIFPVYNANSILVDRLIQVPVIFFLDFITIKRYTGGYAMLSEELLKYAYHDELTGLLNRRDINEVLEKQLQLGNKDMSLVMIDVDNFKLINDRNGHLAGDRVLRNIGNILNKNFNNNINLVSRWGGDEFVVIYFGDQQQLNRIVDNVKKEFKSYANNIEPLTDISIGIASLEECKSVNDIIEKSDQLMYKQKNIKKQELR